MGYFRGCFGGFLRGDRLEVVLDVIDRLFNVLGEAIVSLGV